MKNEDIYLDISNDKLHHVNVLFGGRGIGKTYSILKYRVLEAHNDDSNMSKFIWLRDSDVVVKKIAAGNSLTSPIERNIPDFPHVEFKKNEGNIIFAEVDQEGNVIKELGYLMSLSTFHNARGINYDEVKTIVWDEFIPEDGAVIKNANMQGTIYSNMYESVNRNREIATEEHEAEAPVTMIFLSNTNDIFSDVLQSLGLDKIIEHMQFNELKHYEDEDIWIEFFSNEAFYEAKKDTLLYRLSNNPKFKNMALDNNFNNSLALIQPEVDFRKSKGLLNLDNKYVLVQLNDGSLYWKVGNYKKLQNYDMNNDQEALLFRYLFSDKLRIHYIAGHMFFDSIYTQKNVLDYAKF